MKNYLYGLAQSGFSPGVYWVNKDEVFNIQLPNYCSYGPWNSKDYAQFDMVPDWRANDLDPPPAYADSPPTAHGTAT